MLLEIERSRTFIVFCIFLYFFKFFCIFYIKCKSYSQQLIMLHICIRLLWLIFSVLYRKLDVLRQQKCILPQSWRPELLAGLCFLESSEGESVSHLLTAGGCQKALLFSDLLLGHLSPPPRHMAFFLHLFLQGHRSHWIRGYFDDLIRSWLEVQRPHFQIGSLPEALGVTISIYLFGEQIQNNM